MNGSMVMLPANRLTRRHTAATKTAHRARSWLGTAAVITGRRDGNPLLSVLHRRNACHCAVSRCTPPAGHGLGVDGFHNRQSVLSTADTATISGDLGHISSDQTPVWSGRNAMGARQRGQAVGATRRRPERADGARYIGQSSCRDSETGVRGDVPSGRLAG